MTLQYFPLAVLLQFSPAYAAPSPAKVVEKENLDITEATRDVVTMLSQYASLASENAKLEQQIRETKTAIEAAQEEEKQRIAELKGSPHSLESSQQNAPEQPAAALQQPPQTLSTSFFVVAYDESKKPTGTTASQTEPATAKIYTLNDLFKAPLNFPMEERIYGISLEKYNDQCLVSDKTDKNMCLAREQDYAFAVYTIKKGENTFLDVYIVQGVFVEQEGGDTEAVVAAVQTLRQREKEMKFTVERYVESTEDSLSFRHYKSWDISNDQRSNIEEPYQRALEKIIPLLDKKVDLLIKQKPGLEKQLKDAREQYAQTQSPPAI